MGTLGKCYRQREQSGQKPRGRRGRRQLAAAEKSEIRSDRASAGLGVGVGVGIAATDHHSVPKL